MNNIRINNWLLGASVLFLGIAAVSCEDQPDKFEMSGGVPTVKYVRSTDPAAADSLLDAAYLQNTICLVGNNLRSIHEIWFNDQKAILNTSLITDHTLIVDIPSEIPVDVTDKIYMKTKGGATVAYDFRTLVPNPVVSTMSNEWIKPGAEAVLYGQYFVDDPNVPMEITMPGNIAVPHENILSVKQGEVRFIVPEGATQPGQIDVRTMYGLGRSAFQYHDDRGILFDFDGVSPLSFDGQGWHNRVAKEDENSIAGKYLQLGDGEAELGDNIWNDGAFFAEYWPGDWNGSYPSSGQGMLLNSLVDFSEWENMSLKFEMQIPSTNPWTIGYMQIIVSAPKQIHIWEASWNFFSGGDKEDVTLMSPRAFYAPWDNKDKTFDTAGEWITVTIPFTAFGFDYTRGGTANPIVDENSFGGLTMCLIGSPAIKDDRTCKPILRIDNIRAVKNL